MVDDTVYLEWPGSDLITWDVYERGEHSVPTLVATVATLEYSYAPPSHPTQADYWVLPAGSPGPTSTSPPMTSIVGAATLPIGITSAITPGSNSLSGGCSGVTGPDLCYVIATYDPGVSPSGWLSYTGGSGQSWGFASNVSGMQQQAFLTAAAEEWGRWAAFLPLTEMGIDAQGQITSQCEGYDKVYYTANGYGLSPETGRDVNSTECGYTPPPEPPPEPPVDPDNDGDGVPASSDPDDNDPNNPNPQP